MRLLSDKAHGESTRSGEVVTDSEARALAIIRHLCDAFNPDLSQCSICQLEALKAGRAYLGQKRSEYVPIVEVEETAHETRTT